MSHLRVRKTHLQRPTKSTSSGFNRLTNRRRFLQGFAAAGSLLMLPTPAISQNSRPRLVIIGGGAGGGAFVRAIRARAPDVFDITVVTDQRSYNAPFALNGIPQQQSGPCATVSIDLVGAFERQGVSVVNGRVESVDPNKKTIDIAGANGALLSYDALIAAPGVSLDWGAFGLEGTPDQSAIWTSEASCQNLLNLLRNVPKGGTFALVAPAGHNRCPPAVYERACRAARWFKSFNETAKILIIDEKDQYPMQALFEEAYSDYYEDMIEWIPREFHGGITAIDLSNGKIQTDSELFEPEIINVIPPQQAPDFLRSAGMTGEDGFCKIKTPSMQSEISKDIYVIGDAAAAGEISKSAVSAGVEAELAAVDIVARFSSSQVIENIKIADNCWTLVAPDDAISLGGTYTATGSEFTSVQRFMSVVDDSVEMRKSSAEQAQKWPDRILQVLYGR